MNYTRLARLAALALTLCILVLPAALRADPTVRANTIRSPHIAAAANGPATLVKDINTRPGTQDLGGSVPSQLVSIGATTYFNAQLDSSGSELWKTNGTANGTVLIKDIVPGPNSSNPYGFTNVNGMVFFSADNTL